MRDPFEESREVAVVRLPATTRGVRQFYSRACSRAPTLRPGHPAIRPDRDAIQRGTVLRSLSPASGDAHRGAAQTHPLEAQVEDRDVGDDLLRHDLKRKAA